jgi:uridylate kinase
MSNKYQRILLKLSGEALMGEQNFGIDPQILISVSKEIRQLTEQGVQVGIVIGGGNIFRGVDGQSCWRPHGYARHSN